MSNYSPINKKCPVGHFSLRPACKQTYDTKIPNMVLILEKRFNFADKANYI